MLACTLNIVSHFYANSNSKYSSLFDNVQLASSTMNNDVIVAQRHDSESTSFGKIAFWKHVITYGLDDRQ